MQFAQAFRKIGAIATSPTVLFFAVAFAAWPIAGEIVDFERLHDDWHYDEFALLVFNLTIALTLSLWRKTATLKRLARRTEEERARADRNASHDPLTGLNNRRAFTAVMNATAERLSQKSTACLAMIDLDRFKPVNDLRGHAVGDAVLSAVADRLRDAVGVDARVARLGGDEFAVLFNFPVSIAEVERRARRIVHMMDQAFEVGPLGVSISCSVGLVVWEADLSVKEVMRRADAALYKAKAEGRARFAWYDSELDRKSNDRAALEVDLRAAIDAREIRPWFQPIVDIETHDLMGFEVLARWQHPEKGSVPPQEFIQIAEDCGLIERLSHSVLRQACCAASAWPADLSLSVNVSPVQFASADFVDHMRAAMHACGFDARRLIVEVTESSVIADFEAAGEKLAALKDLGISIALDDFGTGYSSLASLRHLPFDRVKIDRSFISRIEDQPTNQKIVQVIMDLAQGLDLDVTIEGIETAEELTYLETRGRGFGQGFLFEKALPAEDVRWRLETVWTDGRIDPAGVIDSVALEKQAGERS